MIFNNIVWIAAVLLAVGLLILLSYEGVTRLPEKIGNFLFPDITATYSDGTEESFNSYSAANRVWNILFEVLTVLWSWYFLFSVVSGNSSLFKFSSSPESFSEIINTIFFSINILVLVVNIRKALFIIRIPRTITHIEVDKFENYVILASFEYQGAPNYGFENESMSVKILKSKYMKVEKYYVVKEQTTNRTLLKKYNNSMIPYYERGYKVINTSDNFEEVKYQFENMKLELTSNEKN